MCDHKEIDLSKARVGDWVRSVLNGWGEITEANGGEIGVQYPHFKRLYFMSGRFSIHDLYPELIEWQPQKRKVRKELTVYANVYSNYLGVCSHASKEGAEESSAEYVNKSYVIAIAVPCTGYYEVEE